jgi:hypothetical protein
MTTGRINQVTIVRRGWPPAPVRAPERSKLLVRVTGTHRRQRLRDWPTDADDGRLLYPSSVSQGALPPHRDACYSVRVAWGPLEECTVPRGFSDSASTACGFLPMLDSFN